MSKHTPGPWHVLKEEGKPTIIVDSATTPYSIYPKRLCTMRECEGCESNARLIAAAPELARILGAILRTEANDKLFADLCIEAEEILAKATGEE